MESHTPKLFGLVIHGGAGTITRARMTDEEERAYRKALSEALQAGYHVLEKHGSSLDAVQTAINYMEDSSLFNAGKGAVFTHDGKNEQDACIMDGALLNTGAVAGVQHIKNPINLARLVMEKTEHVFLIGEGAEEFAKKQGMELMPADYFFTERRWQQLQQALEKEKKEGNPDAFLDHNETLGTVGVVALDRHGNLAAGTSSGGMTNKRFGRVGDSAICSASTYANNSTCAISTTGHGEYFIRSVTAYDIHALMAYKGMSLEDAVNIAIHDKLARLGGTGGLIAIDTKGNHSWSFNTEGMYRGYKMSDGNETVAIYKSD